MKRQAGMFALCAASLFCVANAAYAKSLQDVATDVSIVAGREIRTGSSPAEVAAFLKMHNFYPTEYSHNYQRMAGHSMSNQDGVFTTDSTQAAFAINMDFQFDERDRLKHYDVDVQKVGE